MRSIASFSFDVDTAKKIGVEEAILLEWIRTRCVINFLEERKFFLDEERWWALVTEHITDNVFPFWKKDRVDALLARLEKNEYILLTKNGKMASTELDIKIRKKRKKKKEKEDVNTKVYTYTREIDGTFQELQGTGGKIVNELVHEFRHINKSYKIFYSRAVQRNALVRMLEVYTPEQMFHMVKMAPIANNMPYAPTITTPLELERLAPKLIAFIQKEHNKNSSGGILF